MQSRKKSKSTSFDPASLKAGYLYALRLLNARDYTVKRLYEKLLAKGYEATVCQYATDQLQDEGWLDDLRYATRFAESAVSSGRYFGPRLQMEMKRRGFTNDVVVGVMEQIRQNNDEDQDISNLLQRRYSDFSFTEATDKEKKRIIGYLQRKGFGLSAIFRTLKSEIYQ